MYHEIEVRESTVIDSIWYADSVDEGVAYTSPPELGANLVLKLHPTHGEVMYSGVGTQQQQYPYIPNVHYFGIRLRAGRHLTNLASPRDLKNTSINLSRQVDWRCLAERLHTQDSLHQQLTLLRETAHQFTASTTALPMTLQEALHYIEARQGVMTVRTLSQQMMMSERQLERLFMAHIGISPKQVCNIVRIRRVLDVLWQSPHHPSLTDLALQFDYTDQAHLANNFRHLIGMSITDYLATL